jgi:hypothetical protein
VQPTQSKTFDSIQILKYKKLICKQLSYLNSVICADIVIMLIKRSCNKRFEKVDQTIGERSRGENAKEETKDLKSYFRSLQANEQELMS